MHALEMEMREDMRGGGSVRSAIKVPSIVNSVAAMQKEIDPKHSLSCQRRARRATLKSVSQVVLWPGALLFAGCVGTTLIPAAQPAAPWPEPGHEVVYNFVTTPGEIILRRGSTTKQHPTSTAVPEKIYLGRRVS
jgi:hypothetical protein